MSFKISDKVVCVDDSPGGASGTRFLTKGSVYVVRGTRVHPIYGTEGVLVVGIALPPGHLCPENYYRASRFRLLSEVQAENRLRAGQHAPQ